MRVTLGDVCEKGSSNLKQSDVINKTGAYPIYGAAGYLGNVDFYHQDKPYVAVVKDGAGIGRTTLHPAKSSVIGTMQYLLPKSNVLPEYLYYVVQYMHLEKYFTGATIPHIYFKDYKAEQFNLDAMERQKEIVASLQKVETLIKVRQQQLQKLDELVKARFVELFGDPILNQKQFPVYRMDEVVEFQGGSQPDKKFFEYEPTDDNIRLIQIRDYKTDKFITYIPRAMAKRFCTADDIMIGRYGPPIFQILQGIEGSFNVALMKATPKKGNKEFVRQFLKQECLLDYLEGMSKRTAGQDGIQMDKLKAYPFPLPPVELQNQFEKFANQVDKSKLQVPSGNALCIRYPIFYRNNIFERSIKC